jgi:predicted transcriptional regulator of viral defense system
MITEPELLQLIRDSEDPFITARDIAETEGMAQQTAYKHLQRLHKQGKLHKKKIGSSAVIWWIKEDC